MARSRSKAANAVSSSSAISSSASSNTPAAAASRSTRGRSDSSFAPIPTILWGQKYPRASYLLVTSTPQGGRGDRRRRIALPRRQAARRRLRRHPHPADPQLRVRGRRLAQRRKPSGGARSQIRRAGSTKASCRANRRARGAGLRAAFVSLNASAEAKDIETILPWLAHDAMMHLTAPHGLEQYSVCGLGHARRLPGPAGTAARARTRRAGQGDPPRRLRPAIREARRLAAMVHARALLRHPGQGGARGHHRLAAEGAVRLYRSDRRLRVPRRAHRLAARRRFPNDRPRRPGRRPRRQAHRNRPRAVHPRHASRPLRQRRLERFAATRRSRKARLDDQQLDRRAPLSAVAPLRRDACARPAAPPPPRNTTRSRRRSRRTSLATSSATASSPATRSSAPRAAPPQLFLHPSDQTTGVSFSLISLTQAILGGLLTAAEARRSASLIDQASPAS